MKHLRCQLVLSRLAGAHLTKTSSCWFRHKNIPCSKRTWYGLILICFYLRLYACLESRKGPKRVLFRCTSALFTTLKSRRNRQQCSTRIKGRPTRYPTFSFPVSSNQVPAAAQPSQSNCPVLQTSNGHFGGSSSSLSCEPNELTLFKVIE